MNCFQKLKTDPVGITEGSQEVEARHERRPLDSSETAKVQGAEPPRRYGGFFTKTNGGP
jgi:hypothetical protein